MLDLTALSVAEFTSLKALTASDFFPFREQLTVTLFQFAQVGNDAAIVQMLALTVAHARRSADFVFGIDRFVSSNQGPQNYPNARQCQRWVELKPLYLAFRVVRQACRAAESNMFADKPLRILHLEDEPDYRLFIRDLLASENWAAEVVEAADRSVRIRAGQRTV